MTRTISGESFMLSPSEVRYLTAILQIHGWPTAPPMMNAEQGG